MAAAELEKELKKQFQGLSAREKLAYEEMNKEDARQVKERVEGKKKKDEMEVEVQSSEDEATADPEESGKEKAKKKKEKKASERKEGKEKEKQEKKRSKSCSVCSNRTWFDLGREAWIQPHLALPRAQRHAVPTNRRNDINNVNFKHSGTGREPHWPR